MIVVVFCVIFLAMLGMVWRQLGSATRTFAMRTTCIQRDQGSVQALADAMHALEVGPPPANPYVCYDTVAIYPVRQLKTYTTDTKTSNYYQITFTRTSDAGVTPRTYSVAVVPVSSAGTLPLNPNDFAAAGP